MTRFHSPLWNCNSDHPLADQSFQETMFHAGPYLSYYREFTFADVEE